MPVFSLFSRNALIPVLVGALWLPPMTARAQEANEATAAEKGEKKIQTLFEGAERHYSHITETAANTLSNPGWFYPLAANNALAVGLLYYTNRGTHLRATQSSVNDMLREVSRTAAIERERGNPDSTYFRERTALETERDRLIASKKAAESLPKPDKDFLKTLETQLVENAKKAQTLSESMDELGRIQKEREVAYKLLREKLIDAKKAMVQEFVGRMSKEEQKLFWAQMKKRGIRFSWQIKGGATTMEELTEALDKLHEIDKVEHSILSRAVPIAKEKYGIKAAGLEIPLHPDALMTKANDAANKMANPRLVARETLAFQDDVVRLGYAASKNSDLAIRGKNLPWFKLRIPVFSKYEPTKLGNASRLVWRKSWPALLLTGTATAATFYYRAQFDMKQAELEGSRLTTALVQNESDALLKELFLSQGAGTLMVQFQWLQMQEKYRERGFNFTCPVNFDDEVDVTLITTAFQAAQLTFLERKESPRDRTRFKPEFYKEFWEAVFRLAEAKQPELKTLPRNVADSDGLISIEELISEFAAGSEVAMLEASGQLDEYHTFLNLVKEMKAKDREAVFKALKSEQMRAVLEIRVKALDRYKTESKDFTDPDPEK